MTCPSITATDKYDLVVQWNREGHPYTFVTRGEVLPEDGEGVIAFHVTVAVPLGTTFKAR